MSKGSSLKNMIRELLAFYKQVFHGYYNTVMTLNWKQFLTRIGSNLMICSSFALFCGLKEGTGDLYMNIFIPLFFANAIIIFYSCVNHSSDLFALLTIFLTTTGAALQIFMLPAMEGDSLQEAKTYVYILFFAVFTSILFVPLVRFLCTYDTTNGFVIAFLVCSTIMIYLCLLIFGTEINNTKAWIIIGGISFQLTEVCKVLALISIHTIIQEKRLNEKKKSVISVLVLCIHAGFLVWINELGTLCIILLITFALRFVFAERKKYVIRELCVVTLLGAIALAGCYGAYKVSTDSLDKNSSSQEQMVESGNVVESELNIDSAESEFDTEKQNTEDAQGSTTVFDELFTRMAHVYPKLEQRVNVFLQSENVSEGDLYQIKQAEDALLAVTFFGTPRGLISVPEIDSDFVFIYLIVRLGIIGVILVFISLMAMLIEVSVKGVCKKKHMGIYMTSFAFVSSIVLQALLCSCSSIGLFPIVGLPFPFLSNGGTALCMNIFMSFFIISYLGENKLKERCSDELEK